MTRLFFNYYLDVIKYNLAFCVLYIVVRAFTTSFTVDIIEAVIQFGTLGVLISFIAFKHFQNIEYDFYINAGLSKRHLKLKTFVTNLGISLFILLIWNIYYR